MNVWIDGLAFESYRQRGVWRVFYEMINRTKDRVNYTIWLQSPPVQPLPSGVNIVRTEGRSELSAGNIRKRMERRWLRTHDPKEMASADLFHSTGFTWPKRESLPSVITLCDMIAESHFSICTREVQESLPIKYESIRRASALACISNTTRDELAAFYPEFADKSHVIRLSTSPERDSTLESVAFNSSQTTREIQPAALYVGQRAGYKNFELLIQAMASPSWPEGITLDVVGAPFNYGEQLLIRRYGLPSRMNHLGTLDDAALTARYRTAHCLIFPSLQEGFGLPCLEAQAAGCPLVCSDLPVFHEVAGDGAIFFDPRVPESLVYAVRAAKYPAMRESVSIAGLNNLNRFDWQTSANDLVALYQRTMKAS